MPLVADYEERISSKVADADNAGGGPGAITAALFLQHFAGGLPWAHLDIASVGDSPADELRVHQGRHRVRGPRAAALAGAARAAGRRRDLGPGPTVTLALVEADPRLQQSYLAALDELAAEGNAHYLDLVVPPGPGFAGRRLHRAVAGRPGGLRGVLRATRGPWSGRTRRGPPAGCRAATCGWSRTTRRCSAGSRCATSSPRGCSRSAATSGTPSGPPRAAAGWPPPRSA